MVTIIYGIHEVQKLLLHAEVSNHKHFILVDSKNLANLQKLHPCNFVDLRYYICDTKDPVVRCTCFSQKVITIIKISNDILLQ